MTKRIVLAALAAGIPFIALPAADAQELSLEEIVVTARKVEENLMEVPLAVTAFSAEELESIDMAELTDIQLYTPSFSFTNQQGGSGRNDRSSNALVFRGLYLNINVGVNAGGLLFIDGAPVVGGYSPSIVDTERVEILKGPQSAYFGRSTFVGALNFVMKEPGDEFGGRFSTDFAKFGSNEQHLMLEGPIVEDTLSARVSVRRWRQGGYIDNFADPSDELGERTTNSVAASIVFTPSDSLKAKLFVNYFEDEDWAATQFALKEDSFNGRGNIDGTCDPLSAPLRAGVEPGSRAAFGYVCGELPSMSELDPAIFSADTVIDSILEKTLFDPNPNWLVFDPDFHRQPGLRREAFQTNLRIDFEHSSGYSFTSLTALHTDRNQNIIDLNYRDGRSRANPFAPLFIGVLGRTDVRPDWNTTLAIQNEQEDWSQEWRLTSPQDKRFRWVGGFSYFDAYSPGQSVYGNLIVGPTFVSAIVEREVETPAVFGAAYFDITPRLTLSAEARYQWDKISENTLITEQQVPPETPLVFSATFTSFAPRISLDYKYADNSTIYVLFSRGFRPGRFNAVLADASQPVLDALRAVAPTASLNILEEKLDNYEMGWKATWLGGRARTTLAIYYDEWLNGQVGNSIPVVADGVANLINIVLNNGTAELRGVEFEGQLQATENLTLSASYGLNDTEVQSFVCGDCNLVYGSFDGVVGNELPSAPRVTWTVSGQYEDNLTANWDWYGRVDWAHQGSRYTDFSNIAKTAPYDNVNIRVGARSQTFSVEAFVQNALDHDEFLQGALGVDLFTFISGPNKNEVRVSASMPRSYGIRFAYNF
ncbi:TonB-dependent receptor [Candidatus Foliamicus sp.]